jgi:3-isopropylmalate dehydrogenase
MSTHTIAILEGDGIGPETMKEAVKVLKTIEAQCDKTFDLQYSPFGACAWFETGLSFPEETKAICDGADAILKGPIGLSQEESRKIPVDEQPERGALLPMRKRYNTFANYRPVYLPSELIDYSPLRPERIQGGIDIIMIRELVGGLYFGEKELTTTSAGLRHVKETLEYDEEQIRQILVIAFEEARGRKKFLHSVHKSNVLMSSVLWNEVLDEVAQDYPDIEVKHVIVDAAATALVVNPQQFDVMVMENMFGDILSDLGGGILGSLGLMPSACIGPDKAYYEPSHGSAPDIAGQGIANPYSMIGSVALMLDKSFGLRGEARRIRDAMCEVFSRGYTTRDLKGADADRVLLGTEAFGDMVVEILQQDQNV